MSEKLQERDKVRVMYWDELPKLPHIKWDGTFFEKFGGKTGEIVRIRQRITLSSQVTIQLKDVNGYLICNIKALMKLNKVPDELFEI